jgi:uracil-DNA glycosylase
VTFPFGHGGLHRLGGGLTLADSYHCSRPNTNTGRLSEAMFHKVFADVAQAMNDTLSRPRAGEGSEGASPSG